MEHAVKASYHNVVLSTTLTYVFDVKGWISGHLHDIRYHTEPHIFWFKRNLTTGHAEMFYKHWSNCKWEPGRDGLVLLKVCDSLSLSLSLNEI